MQMDEDQNYLCNGDFEDPPLPDGKGPVIWDSRQVPCWAATKDLMQIGEGESFVDTMKTQVMELSTNDKVLSQGFKQAVNVSAGDYTLKFDYAPRQKANPEVSTFFVYWNGREVGKYRPPTKAVRTQTLTVHAEDGQNIVEFVDASTNPPHGAVIDNAGLYQQKRSKFQLKEIDAVSAGGVVRMSSVWDENYNMYELDREGAPGLTIGAWCPKNNLIGNWIQVSSENLRFWNSVTIQGRNSGKYPDRVTKFKLMYSLDGHEFREYENGRVFTGNTDQGTKVRHNLQPFYARTIRLYPLGYSGGFTCLRWGATYIVEQ